MVSTESVGGMRISREDREIARSTIKQRWKSRLGLNPIRLCG